MSSIGICPTCKQALPWSIPKTHKGMDKRLAQDRRKATESIAICTRALTNPWFANIQEAVKEEIRRLSLAIETPQILWRIYRRKDKGPVYY